MYSEFKRSNPESAEALVYWFLARLEPGNEFIVYARRLVSSGGDNFPHVCDTLPGNDVKDFVATSGRESTA
jgi:hypothetical protein